MTFRDSKNIRTKSLRGYKYIFRGYSFYLQKENEKVLCPPLNTVFPPQYTSSFFGNNVHAHINTLPEIWCQSLRVWSLASEIMSKKGHWHLPNTVHALTYASRFHEANSTNIHVFKQEELVSKVVNWPEQVTVKMNLMKVIHMAVSCQLFNYFWINLFLLYFLKNLHLGADI